MQSSAPPSSRPVQTHGQTEDVTAPKPPFPQTQPLFTTLKPTPTRDSSGLLADPDDADHARKSCFHCRYQKKKCTSNGRYVGRANKLGNTIAHITASITIPRRRCGVHGRPAKWVKPLLLPLSLLRCCRTPRVRGIQSGDHWIETLGPSRGVLSYVSTRSVVIL